jgi:hypothetical protein
MVEWLNIKFGTLPITTIKRSSHLRRVRALRRDELVDVVRVRGVAKVRVLGFPAPW